MVTRADSSAAELLAVSVSALNPVVGFGANEAVTPLGRPLTDRLTLPVNPGPGTTSTVDVAEVPGFKITERGGIRLKLGTGGVPKPLSVMLWVV